VTVTWRILQGDVCERLASLPAESVQTCVTSPPYWGLRDYGTARWEGGDPSCDHQELRGGVGDASSKQVSSAGASTTYQYRYVCRKCDARRIDAQIGLEPTPAEYVTRMVEVFAEVHRVLRDDGTLWLNLGDSYAANQSNNGGYSDKSTLAGFSSPNTKGRIANESGLRRSLTHGVKPKDLVGIPWMVAFALRDYGWYLRSEIIWHKPNPMPESVTDRPTKSHEQIFLFSKSARYYYDAEAIKEEGVVPAGTKRRFGAVSQAGDRNDEGRHNNVDGTRNKRSVWTVATQPYPEAHFATYPEALIEPCILAGTSERGQCQACGAPWERVVDRTPTECRPTPYDAGRPDGMTLRGTQFTGGASQTTGWQPSCACNAGDPVPQLVLDPFTGSGTTGAVAIRHQRSFIGTELNPAYIELARRRIGDVAPLLASEVA